MIVGILRMNKKYLKIKFGFIEWMNGRMEAVIINHIKKRYFKNFRCRFIKIFLLILNDSVR